jgi:hypothetical protein
VLSASPSTSPPIASIRMSEPEPSKRTLARRAAEWISPHRALPSLLPRENDSGALRCQKKMVAMAVSDVDGGEVLAARRDPFHQAGSLLDPQKRSPMSAPRSTASWSGGKSRVMLWRFVTKTSHFSLSNEIVGLTIPIPRQNKIPAAKTTVDRSTLPVMDSYEDRAG